MRISLLLFLLSLITAENALLAQTHTGPILTFEKSLHDFGRLLQGPSADYTFYFQNTGDAPLLIQKCSTSDPHTADWTKEPVLPGKRGKILVSMPTQGRIGQFERGVRIRSNAANGQRYGTENSSEMEIRIKGNVEHDSARVGLAWLATEFVWFDTVAVGRTKTVAVRCSNVGKIPLRITGLESTVVWRAARYEDLFQLWIDDDSLSPGESTVLRLTLNTRDAAPGALNSLLYLGISNGVGSTIHADGWVRPERKRSR